MSNSLKKNYLLNLINTISGIVFPLITFPYASRILQAEGIGIINFYNSIITYISLMTCLGIPLYATREVAKVKHSQTQLSKVSTEILCLHLLLTVLGYLVVAVLTLTVPKIQAHSEIFLILSSSIIFTAMGCEWFYRGTEDFKYITVRGLIIRICYIPLLFCFVRTKSDLLNFAVLTVMVSVGNNIFNFYRLSHKVQLRDIKYAFSKPFRHLKGALKIFALTAAISLYTQLNIVILGFMSSSVYVGYYVGATKITSIIAGVVTALQTSLLPRTSSLLAMEDISGFKNTASKVLNFIYCVAIPLAAGLFAMAAHVIYIVCGDSYEPAVPTLRIISPVLFIIAMSGFISGGILLPQGKENIATFACLTGAVVNIIINVTLIPYMFQNGTAVASLLTELTVTSCMVIKGRKYIPIPLWNNRYSVYILGSVFMMGVCMVLNSVLTSTIAAVILIPSLGVVIYSSILLVARDPLAIELIGILKKRLFRGR